MTGKNVERILLESAPEKIKYLSRDEDGELWLTAKEPVISENNGKKQLSFEFTDDFTDTYSFAVYNHLFQDVENMSILEISL